MEVLPAGMEIRLVSRSSAASLVAVSPVVFLWGCKDMSHMEIFPILYRAN